MYVWAHLMHTLPVRTFAGTLLLRPCRLSHDAAVPFRHGIEVEPLRNSKGEAVLYKVRSGNVSTLLEHITCDKDAGGFHFKQRSDAQAAH